MKHRLSVLITVVAFAFATVAFAQTAPDSVKKAEPAIKHHKVEATEKSGMEKPAKPGKMQETLLQRINSAKSLSTFASLLKEADLEKTLEGPGEYTVFAPSDEAFKALPAETMNSLKQDKAKLADVLKNHIVAGKRISRMELAKMKGQKVTAQSGLALAIAQTGGKWMIGNAALSGVNLKSTNGPIHEVDSVITAGEAAAAPMEKTVPDHTGVKADKK
ncbi:MAG TPA: fasciclin domain-containing protein [bacterium]|jgi:uncharacterized surface protein with fasciclin (FAS1) repeats